MKKFIAFICIAIFMLSFSEKEPLKIACVGDSITYGAGIMNREDNSYPVLLDKMLGADYDVRNFGMSGRTMLFNTDRSYKDTKNYTEMLAFKPDVVLICLGTNDSKTYYRDIVQDYEKDYNAFLDSVRQALPEARIILLTPPKNHNDISKYQIDKDFITSDIMPTVKRIAYNNSLELIDTYPIFSEKIDYLMPDGVHPSAMGALLMSIKIRDYLQYKTEDYTFEEDLGKSINFNGFDSYQFEFEGKAARVAVPRQVAEGRPWLWRARFWGVAPAVDIALLERGFHIVYTDVADMFGSDEAVAQWERFYDYLMTKGLNPKCAIEGMSRGGLIAYNFAVKNPEKVSIVYADAPVLDIKSWPFKNEKYGKVTEKLLAAYGFQSDEEAKLFDRNPMDNATKIAKGGFDMIHVCGNADVVVPISENTTPFIEKVKAAGGNINYIEKDGIGHHPHGLENGDPIVKQILISTGYYSFPTLIPTPAAEYRVGFDWASVAQEIEDSLTSQKYDILLIGNSITQGFGSNRKLVNGRPGKESMDAGFPDKSWFSAGINGDRTQNIMYRMLNYDYAACDPEYVILTIGVNNLNAGGDSAEHTLEGIIKCVEVAQERMPNSKIILFGTLPAQKHIEKCLYIAKELKKHKWGKNVKYVDPFTVFAPDKKNVKEELYGKDKLHLSEQGYKAWVELMKKHIK